MDADVAYQKTRIRLYVFIPHHSGPRKMSRHNVAAVEKRSEIPTQKPEFGRRTAYPLKTRNSAAKNRST
jgi:hypothetical protein